MKIKKQKIIQILKIYLDLDMLITLIGQNMGFEITEEEADLVQEKLQ